MSACQYVCEGLLAGPEGGTEREGARVGHRRVVNGEKDRWRAGEMERWRGRGRERAGGETDIQSVDVPVCAGGQECAPVAVPCLSDLPCVSRSLCLSACLPVSALPIPLTVSGHSAARPRIGAAGRLRLVENPRRTCPSACVRLSLTLPRYCCCCRTSAASRATVASASAVRRATTWLCVCACVRACAVCACVCVCVRVRIVLCGAC